MAFTYTLNTPLVGFAEALLELKDRLVADGGWVVSDSGDGTTYGNGGDIITVAGTGAGGNANSFSWWRLTAPDGRELLFQHGFFNPGTDNYVVRYSPTGFVRDDDGAPSGTVAPTALDEVLITGNQRFNNPSGDDWAGALGNSGGQRWDFAIGDAAEGHSFYAFGRQGGVGNVNGGMLYEQVLDANPADVDPYVIWCPSDTISSINQSIFDDSALWNQRGEWTPKYPDHDNRGSGVAGLPWGFQLDPTNEPAAAALFLPYMCMADGPRIFDGAASNPYDGLPDLIDGVDWYFRLTAAGGSFSQFGAPRALRKGRSRILLSRSQRGPNIMDTPTDLSRAYQEAGRLGAIWYLWDGSTTPIL